MVGAAGVVAYMGALLAVLVLLVVWFKGFLALYCLACALIQQRLWLIAKHWSISSFSVCIVVKLAVLSIIGPE